MLNQVLRARQISATFLTRILKLLRLPYVNLNCRTSAHVELRHMYPLGTYLNLRLSHQIRSGPKYASTTLEESDFAFILYVYSQL